MTADISPEIQTELEKAYVIWFTTVRADGMPQPTPVWFVWDNGSFLIYTTPKAQKYRNIQANPKVALNLDDTCAQQSPGLYRQVSPGHHRYWDDARQF